MIPSLSIGPRALLNDCNHSATAIFWRSAIYLSIISECHLFMKAPGADMSSAARRGSANGASSGSAGTGPRTAQRGGRGVFQQLCCPKEATFRAEDAGEAAVVRDNSRSNLM